MSVEISPAAELLDPLEKRLRRIHPLLLLTTVYKQFWNTIGLLMVVSPLLIALVVAVRWAVGQSPQPIRLEQLGLSFAFGIGLIVLLIVLAYFFDLATRLFSLAGGILWLLLGLVTLVQLVRVFQYFAGAAEVAGRMAEAAPWPGGAVAFSIVVAIVLAFHYVWVIGRGAFALLLMPAQDRKTMRDAPPGSSFASRFLVGFWSLPPTFEFARRPRLRFAAILFLAVLGSLFVSLAGVVLLILLFPFYGQAGWLGTVAQARGAPPGQVLLGLLFYLGIFAALLIVGGGARALMRRLVRTSLDALQRADTRAPILFLRAFGDDQVPLKPPRLSLLARMLEVGQRRANLDRLLLDEATSRGPVVGLGNPTDKRPPYGAARGYFDDKTWQQAVADLARNAACIVVCLDDTDGIWWEVEHLTGGRHLAKTLFLVHPKHAGAAENAKLLARVAYALGLPAEAAGALRAIPVGQRQAPVLAFCVGDGGGVRALHSTTFSRFAYLLAIRAFLRGRFVGEMPAASPAPNANAAAPPPRAAVPAPAEAAAPRRPAPWWTSAPAQLLILALFAGLLYGAYRLTPGPDSAPPKSFRDCPACPEMVAIPAGSFAMGSPSGDPQARAPEFPQHPVTIGKRFALAKFELTYDEWDACADDGACVRWSGNFGRGRHPVAGIPIAQTAIYLAWLSRKTGKIYRLPTEAEWEYAARAGTTTRYSWGDEPGKKRAHCAECEAENGWRTVTVGRFPPNGFGLHDMHGNVGEFVADCWHADHFGAPPDGSRRSDGGARCAAHVARGGGHDRDAAAMRSAARARIPPEAHFWHVGFRVARDLD